MSIINNKNGVALIFVLWVLIMLSVITGQFCYSMRNEINSARLQKGGMQAYYHAYAGISITCKHLVQSWDIQPASQKENVEYRINLTLPYVPFGNGEYQVFVSNESGKINLNYAGRDLLELLFFSFGLEEDEYNVIIDSILDWRDKDDLHRLNGAESDYYQTLPEPYMCRNGFFKTIDELLLVKGMTRELFNNGLKEIITIVQQDKQIKKKKPKKKRAEPVKININSASPQLLSIFPEMTKEIIDEITLFRLEKDYKDMAELQNTIGSESFVELRKHINFKNNKFFTIQSAGSTNDIKSISNIRAMIEIIENPSQQNSYSFKIIQWMDSTQGI